MHRTCLLTLCLLGSTIAFAEDWPQWRGPSRDGVWIEPNALDKFPADKLEPIWRQEIGSGYSGPTVAQGRVYVMDRQTQPKQVERVHCFDSKTGKPAWTHTYDCQYQRVGYQAGPRASVAVVEGRAYSLGTMGHLFCFDAAKGDVLWKHDLDKEYKIEMPIWGISASPVVVGDLVVVHCSGREGACIVAFDRKDGTEKWKALNERGQYSTPAIVAQGGKTVLICWTGDSVSGLEAESGKVLWSHPFKPSKMPIGCATPVVSGDKVLCTSFYDGTLLLKLNQEKPGADLVYHKVGRSEQQTEALQGIISTPVIDGDYIYGVDSYGELRCLSLATGERIWEDLTATPKIRWGTIHFVRNGDKYWMFNERGELIIAKLSPKGFEALSRTKLIEPTEVQLSRRGGVCWSHPAYAEGCVFARNDKEIVCAKVTK